MKDLGAGNVDSDTSHHPRREMPVKGKVFKPVLVSMLLKVFPDRGVLWPVDGEVCNEYI